MIIVTKHVAFRAAHVGAILAGTIGLPFMAIRHKNRVPGELFYRVTDLMVQGSVAGAIAGCGLAVYRLHSVLKEDSDAAFDRAYRLRYNAGQNRVDMYSVVGGIVGGIGFAVLGTKAPHGRVNGGSTLKRIGRGTTLGIVSGLICHGLLLLAGKPPSEL